MQIVLTNQYGETSINTIIPVTDDEGAIAFADALPPKTGVAALAAITTPNAATQTSSYVQADAQSIATLANQLKAQYNLLLAALQATE